MADPTTVDFLPWSEIAAVAREEGPSTLTVFAGENVEFAPATAALLGAAAETVRKAAATARFKGAVSTSLELYAPQGLAFARLLVIGTALKKPREGAGSGTEAPAKSDFVSLGGFTLGKAGAGRTCVAFDPPASAEASKSAAADFMLGARLRSYKFDLYKTKKKDDEEKEPASRLSIAVENPGAIDATAATAVAEGVAIARNLVNEPANVLYPEEFARRTLDLQKLGVEVEILDMQALSRIGMRALLGVGQGSVRESRVAIMRWNGRADEGAKPVAFIGKGVCFDTGGISIKPASGMEDMKGDMAGAACVVGLMHALASRKAKVKAIGVIGLVENMPDGAAQRPGDIVESLSGQTVEIINTDAEGRLVLADLLWYVQDKYAPQFMIDLATLTGAILVALGSEHAGLFCNDDQLSERLVKAGAAVGEKVWRMPLGPAYDKLLDSKFADMKNVGGRHAGSITAAQFLQRFVKTSVWAHLDIAGTAMSSPQTDINQSWGSGWGVRLLDRLVADSYEP
jgi:leucyl aminopeptidase